MFVIYKWNTFPYLVQVEPIPLLQCFKLPHPLNNISLLEKNIRKVKAVAL